MKRFLIILILTLLTVCVTVGAGRVPARTLRVPDLTSPVGMGLVPIRPQRVPDGSEHSEVPDGSEHSEVTDGSGRTTTCRGGARPRPQVAPTEDIDTTGNTGRATRLECPALSTDTLYSQYVEWSTDDYGITYAYEYNTWLRASRWVCWQLHPGNSIKNTFRYSRFIEDDSIKKGYRVVAKNFYMTGMNRGHICPAQDRLCSRDQNKQTFHLGTNIAPQYPNHNTGIWADFEDWITDSLNNDEFRDTLYLCKGATIDDDHIAGYTKRTKLIISQYWFGALLVRKDSVYKSIAYLTEHTDTSTSGASLADYVISVDSLECLTGLDFFCNLDDSIETAVEATVDTAFWRL